MKTKAFFLDVTFSSLAFAETPAQWSPSGSNDTYILGNVGMAMFL